jgi:hypothetical protein
MAYWSFGLPRGPVPAESLSLFGVGIRLLGVP